MCDCVCHLLHHLHNGRVQICGRILQSCRGTVKVLLQYQHIILVLRLKVTFYFFLLFFLQVFGFIATIVFALDFYFIFNELATFLKAGGESNDEPTREPGNNCYH